MTVADELDKLVRSKVKTQYEWGYTKVEGKAGKYRLVFSSRDGVTQIVQHIGRRKDMEEFITNSTDTIQSCLDLFLDTLKQQYELKQTQRRHLKLFLAEHLLGWQWIDGPKYDIEGPCEWEQVLIPPNYQPDSLTYPPRGKIAKDFFVCNRRWLDSYDVFREIELALRSKGKLAEYLNILSQSRPAGTPPMEWVVLSTPHDRCMAAAKTISGGHNVQ